MAIEDVRVYEISTASVSADLNNQEIAFENVNDSDLGWKMFGGKNAIGETTLFLGKDKAARVSTLQATGNVTIVSGTITIDSLSLSTAADNQVMYGNFQQSSAFTYVNGNLGLGVTPEIWHATQTVFQIGGLTSLWAATSAGASGGMYFSQNVYYDGAFKRIVDDEASMYFQGNGEHAWYSNAAGDADVGFSPTVRMAMLANGNIGFGENNPTTAKVVIKNVAGTTPAMVITNNSDAEIFKVWHSGHISNVDGMNTISADKGSGISTHNFGEGAPEHTNGVGSYDHTGGTHEQLFTKTSGDDFTQNDADTAAFIVMIGGVNNGAAAEIKTYIDGDNVTVFGFNWDDDLVSQTFFIYKHPTFVTEDGNITEVSAGSTGKFEVLGYQFTGEYVQEIELKSGGDDTNALLVKVNANGYNHNDAIHIAYDTGDLQPGDHVHVKHIQVDETSATSADSTTEIEFIRCDTTNLTDLKKTALSVGSGFDFALAVVGQTPFDPGYGYTVLSTSVVDRVNSGGGGDDAFVNPAVDQALFAAVNDYFLVGHGGEVKPFEVITINLATNGSQNSELEFYYSKAGGGWTEFFPSDGTNGLQNSGNIIFPLPGDWTADDEAESNGDITNGWYIKILRTKLGTYTQPIEDFIQVLASKDTGMQIKGDGSIAPADISDADASNDSIYFSTTQQVLVYKRNGTVYDLH